jgi:uncharacterized protein YjiS (DUF1127 family)
VAKCPMITYPGPAAALELPMRHITWLSAHPLRRDRPAYPLEVPRYSDQAMFDVRGSANRRARLAEVLGLYRAFKQWREHRRTLRALAKLDDRMLRDIGLTRGDTRPWWFADKSRHALSLLDDSQLIHLSDLGRERWRKVRHGGSGEQSW